jgi:hypothetical protein
MNWNGKFARPISTRRGPELRSLADARAYIQALPPTLKRSERWRTAIRTLVLASMGGATSIAESAIRKALDEASARLRTVSRK